MSPDLHNQLLRAYLDPALDAIQIADKFGLSVQQLMQWARSPQAREDIEGFREMLALRAQVLAEAGLPAAVEALDRITHTLADFEPDAATPLPIQLRLADTIRKSATALQRIAKRNPQSQPRHGNAADQEDRKATAHTSSSTAPPVPPLPASCPPDPRSEIRDPRSSRRPRDRPVAA